MRLLNELSPMKANAEKLTISEFFELLNYLTLSEQEGILSLKKSMIFLKLET